jgi:hypothetical protein
MATTPASTKGLPLPVRVFNAAMEQQLSLDAYAQSLGITSEGLRAAFTAQLNHGEAASLDQLADLYDLSHETLRDQVRIAPPQETFAAWLKRNMEGVSQHALRTRVQLDAKTLRRFLTAEMLPDSDQAERISRALYIDRMEIARVVAANMVHQADAERLVATTSTAAGPRTVAPVATAEAVRVRAQRTRRRSTTSDADPATVQGAAAPGTALAEPAREGEQLRRAASRRHAGTRNVDAVSEQRTAPEDERPRRSASLTAAGGKTAALPAPSTPAAPVDPTRDAAATGVERPEQPAARGRTTPPTAVPAMAPTAPSSTNSAPVPLAETKYLRRPTARRQAGTTAAAASETIAARGGSALARQGNPPAAATESEAIPALNAPDQPTRRTQRRVRSVSEQAVANATLPTLTHATVDPPAGAGAVDVDPATETVRLAAPTPTALVQPAGLTIETDGALPRVSPLEQSAPPLATSDATAAPAPAPATVPSVLAAETTTLQLTADEVRLIRHWRQLHPHGRRATLHYIGSLLVDE